MTGVDLLGSPVARVATLAMVNTVADEPQPLTFDLSLLESTWVAQAIANQTFGHVEMAALRNSSDAQLLRVFGDVIGNFHHGFGPRAQARMRVLDDLLPALCAAQSALSLEGRFSWWRSGVASEQLLTEGALGVMFDVGETRYDLGSTWWSVPMTRHTLQSTRGPVAVYPSVAAFAAEDPQSGSPRTTPFSRPVGPVFEVGSSEDWRSLVNRYPHALGDCREWARITGWDGPWVGPDWDAVARDFVGVHLSFAGYLDCAYAPQRIGASCTMVAGWDPDATVWFAQDPQTTRAHIAELHRG